MTQPKSFIFRTTLAKHYPFPVQLRANMDTHPALKSSNFLLLLQKDTSTTFPYYQKRVSENETYPPAGLTDYPCYSVRSSVYTRNRCWLRPFHAGSVLSARFFRRACAHKSSRSASLHVKTSDVNPCAAFPVRRILFTRLPPTRNILS